MTKVMLNEEARKVEDQYAKASVVYGIFVDSDRVGEITLYVPLSEEEAEELEVDVCDDWVHCESVEVYKEYRNLGYGTAALEKLAEIYGRYTITPNNADAQRLYERLGSEDLTWPDAYYTDQGYGVYKIY